MIKKFILNNDKKFILNNDKKLEKKFYNGSIDFTIVRTVTPGLMMLFPRGGPKGSILLLSKSTILIISI